MKRIIKASIIPVGLGAFLVLMWALLRGVTIDVLAPSGKIAAEQLKLLYFTLSLSVLVIVPVFTMLGVFAYKYREGRDEEYRPEFDNSAKLETLWWGIPILIIGVLGVTTWYTSHTLDPYNDIASDKAPVEVQVVALQWKWLFIYPEYDIATINELPMPVDRPVHFNLAADAPMSAFWIPKLGSQMYSMNGMNSELNLIADKVGKYDGYNTNINGEGYADMTFVADVMSEKDFDTWSRTAGSKAMKNDYHLDESSYTELAKPSTISEPRTYHLMKKDLYDTIMMKYMHPESDRSEHKSDTDSESHSTHTQHGGSH